MSRSSYNHEPKIPIEGIGTVGSGRIGLTTTPFWTSSAVAVGTSRRCVCAVEIPTFSYTRYSLAFIRDMTKKKVRAHINTKERIEPDRNPSFVVWTLGPS